MSGSFGGLLRTITTRKPAAAPKASPTKPLSTHLSDHDGPHAEKNRTSITSRLLLALVGISMALNLVMGVSILQLLPMYRVVPFFVTFSDRADQIVRIEPPTGSLNSLELMTQKEVESYVLKRFTITNDPQETIDRWMNYVMRRSTSSVQEDFKNETKPVYDQLTERRMTRSIDIVAVQKIDNSGLWRVEFIATDRKQGQGLTDGGEDKRAFIAQMRVENRPTSVAYNDRFLNPLGFTVTQFSVTSKRQ